MNVLGLLLALGATSLNTITPVTEKVETDESVSWSYGIYFNEVNDVCSSTEFIIYFDVNGRNISRYYDSYDNFLGEQEFSSALYFVARKNTVDGVTYLNDLFVRFLSGTNFSNHLVYFSVDFTTELLTYISAVTIEGYQDTYALPLASDDYYDYDFFSQYRYFVPSARSDFGYGYACPITLHYAFLPNTLNVTTTRSAGMNWQFYQTYELDDFNVYQNGYDDGYGDGYLYGQSKGYSAGEDAGYGRGYSDGANNAHEYTFANLFGAISDTPVLLIRNLFNFDLFGVNVLTVVLSLFTALILFYLLRKLF